MTSEAVVIAEPLIITAQPQNDRGNPGDQATFTVAVSGGKAPYTYQWQMRDYYFDWENLTNGSWFTGVNTASSESFPHV